MYVCVCICLSDKGKFSIFLLARRCWLCQWKFYSLKLFLLGEKRSRFTTHFHILRGIKLLCWWFTRTHREKSWRKNLDKLTQIYARRIKLNFIKCDYIKTFLCASIDIGKRNFFMHLFYACLFNFPLSTFGEKPDIFQLFVSAAILGPGKKAMNRHQIDFWIIKITDKINGGAGNQRLIADRLWWRNFKTISRTVKSPRFK